MGLLSIIRKVKRREREIRVLLVYVLLEHTEVQLVGGLWRLFSLRARACIR